ncbi:MAG: DUF2892 domain-containing protein [Nanoarchaeota archaeon]|nr:DUF2892 domain-containing protein [Nanoarchaeota archaeon]
MKAENMGINESVIRIVLGIMIFILFWFHTLGYIQLGLSKNYLLLMLFLSIHLLITGSARISLIKKLLKIK